MSNKSYLFVAAVIGTHAFAACSAYAFTAAAHGMMSMSRPQSSAFGSATKVVSAPRIAPRATFINKPGPVAGFHRPPVLDRSAITKVSEAARPIKGLGQSAIDKVTEAARQAANKAAQTKGLGQSAIDKVTEAARQAADKAAQPKGLGQSAIDKVTEAARQAADKAAQPKGLGQSAIDKVTEAARQAADKAAQTKGLGESAIEKVREAARQAAEKAAREAAQAAREAAQAHAKLQNPLDPKNKVGSNVTPETPSKPSDPGNKSGDNHRPRFPLPGGVVVFGSNVGDYPAVGTGPTVGNSTNPAFRPATSSRLVDAAAGATAQERPRTPPAEGKCDCLVKQYLQDGSVLFMDICTKESATAAPTNDGTARRDPQ